LPKEWAEGTRIAGCKEREGEEERERSSYKFRLGKIARHNLQQFQNA
jgi:hypothetical protein